MTTKLFTAVGRWLRSNAWDILSFAGLGLTSAGLAWWLHPGAGLIVAGIGTLALGLYGSYQTRNG